MAGDEDWAGRVVPPPANDNGAGTGEAERHLRTIAQAIGRQIAREHFATWERKRRRAANDNAPGAEPEEEGSSPEG